MTGPAEITASLKELCVDEGPRLTTSRIVRWLEDHRMYESPAELIAFAKKMKARQYARLLTFEDEESGVRVKRLWSFRDRTSGERYYHDILELPDDKRRDFLRQYAQFQERLRSVRRAMADYFAGQQFLDFYIEDDDEESAIALPREMSRRASG
ncbi:MAG: hypothetical protein NVSMB14_15640 [Isosphaeraceae bacterium]